MSGSERPQIVRDSYSAFPSGDRNIVKQNLINHFVFSAAAFVDEHKS